MNVGYTKLTQTKAILKELQDKGVRPVHGDARKFRQKVREDKFNNMRTRRIKRKEIDKKALIQQVIEIKTRNATINSRKARKARKARKTARNTMAIRDSNLKAKKDKEKKVPVKFVIDNNPQHITRNSLLQSLRTSIKPLENYKVRLPILRALSMKTGSRRFINSKTLKRANTI